MAQLPISVIIPALNAARFIRQAIRSVQRQTVSVAEIIVVDDFSTDRTAAVAERMGAVVLRKKKDKPRGVSASRNLGIEASSGEWVAFLDADDYWDKRKIEFQWEALRESPDAALATCYTRMLFQDRDPVTASGKWSNYGKARPPRACRKVGRYASYYAAGESAALLYSLINSSNVLLRRDIFENLEAFDENLSIHEDTDLWLRIITRFPSTVVHRKLVTYRRHSNNTSANETLFEDSLIMLAEKVLESPEKYPPNFPERLAAMARAIFVKRSRMAAQKIL